MFTEHLLHARHRKAPKHNSDLEDRPISCYFLCSVVSVDTGRKEYGSSVKEDVLEVASQWNVEVSEGRGAKGMSGMITFASSSMSVLGKEAFSYGGAWRGRKDRTTCTARPC